MDTNTKERMGIIYQARCLVTGKSYIGQTVVGLVKRKWRHLKDSEKGCDFYFHRAIRKYGAESFRWTTVATAPEHRLENLERAFIKTMNTFGSGGYNLTEGGSCGKMSEETKAKISKALIGNDYALGYKHSEETCRKNREAQKGKHGGEKSGTAKLTEKIVIAIKKELKVGIKGRSLAKKCGVGEKCISKIKTGIRWKHIKLEEK